MFDCPNCDKLVVRVLELEKALEEALLYVKDYQKGLTNLRLPIARLEAALTPSEPT